jgi:hypothetical protein
VGQDGGIKIARKAFESTENVTYSRKTITNPNLIHAEI